MGFEGAKMMDDDPNFDKLMEEIFPMSIPTEYV